MSDVSNFMNFLSLFRFQDLSVAVVKDFLATESSSSSFPLKFLLM